METKRPVGTKIPWETKDLRVKNPQELKVLRNEKFVDPKRVENQMSSRNQRSKGNRNVPGKLKV